MSLEEVKQVSFTIADGGSGDDWGHLAEMRVDPIGLFHRVREECGDIGRFRLADRDVVMVSGAEANEQFFRAPDSTLDQAAAYPFMTPIFGKGVVFDASPEERQQMLKNQALRGDMMRGHARTIEAEIRRMVDRWGDEGEIDLLDWFAELTIYTTSACLIGRPFREELDSSFAHHYHELERGTDAIATSTRTPTSSRSAAVTPPASSWWSWCRRSSTGAGREEMSRARNATCSTCSSRST
jgi:sterol 14-demethylase